MLTPCPRCRRHVRADERACPFCREGLASTSHVEIELPRMSRGQLVALAVVLSSACGPAPAPTVATGAPPASVQPTVEAPAPSAPAVTAAPTPTTAPAPPPAPAPPLAPSVPPKPTDPLLTTLPTANPPSPYYPGASAYGAPPGPIVGVGNPGGGPSKNPTPGEVTKPDPVPNVAVTTPAASPHKEVVVKSSVRFRNCAIKASQVNPTLAATATVTLTIGTDGKPVDVKATLVGASEPTFAACLESAARTLKFEPVSAPLPTSIKVVVAPKN